MASFGANFHLMRRRLGQSALGYIRPHLFISVDVEMSSAAMKPPNVLVYVPQIAAVCPKECILNVIEKYLPENRYVVYSLKPDQALRDPWMENCRLLIVPSLHPDDEIVKFKPEEYNILRKFFESGGAILSFCAEFSNHFGLSTAKVDVNELQLVDEAQNFIVKSSSISCWNGEVLTIPTILTKQLNLDAVLSVKHGNSSLGIAAAMCVNKCKGQLLHSAIPLVQFCSKSKCRVEMCSPEAGVLLQKFLAQLGFKKTMDSEVTNLTPCFLLGTDFHLVETFLSEVGHEVKGVASNLRFIQAGGYADSNVGNIKDLAYIPVLYSTTCVSPVQFDWHKYAKNLTTKNFGKLVLYSDVVTSTMDIVEPIVGRMYYDKDFCITCIARQQTSGKGRGGNKWISPAGTAMFTIAFSIPLQSHLGQRLSILQHLMTVAVVHGVRSLPGLDSLDLRVKWPNDIYVGNEVKIGGVLVKSTIFHDRCVATIGCGVNVSNEFPTKCINDVIEACNLACLPLTCEEVLAHAISHLEKLIASYQRKGPVEFLNLYYKYWIHSGQRVNVCQGCESKSLVAAEVVGIDDCGFLRVTVIDDDYAGVREQSLQPDSNSFDMTKNLIATKS